MTRLLRPGWYAVMAAPQREFAAAGEIRRDAGLRVWAPWRWKETRHARRVRTKRVPTFSRYIFAEMTQDHIGLVNQIRHVSAVVSSAGMAMPVPETVMREFFAQADGDHLELEAVAPDMEAGEPLQPFDFVRILDGPFAERIGEVDDVGRRDIGVWIEMMGGARVRIRASRGRLEKVPPDEVETPI